MFFSTRRPSTDNFLMATTQELEQSVCHRYGWSAEYELVPDVGWVCTVTVGVNDRRQFVSNTVTTTDPKAGKAAAATVALQGLREEIQRLESMPQMELSDVFTQPIPIYESNDANWTYFWNHKPKVVGIDTEGNRTYPPILVQVATENYCILEVPIHATSKHLMRLMADKGIIKVFCDNMSHKDKKCLKINDIPDDLTQGHIVDLESITATHFGRGKVDRGLTRIVTLCMPELNVQIRKPKRARLADIGRFALMEQGKIPRIQSVWNLSPKERQYAALDAWCTLQAYNRLQEYSASGKTQTDFLTA